MPILDALNIRDKSVEHNTEAHCLKDIRGHYPIILISEHGRLFPYLGLQLSIRKTHKKIAYDTSSSNRKIHP